MTAPPADARRIDPDRRYVLISPCRNEAKHMRRTLDSVAAQTVPPASWVVVDDGSSDTTAEILAEYTRKLPYLRVVRRPDRGRRSVGPGVVEAFEAGLATVDLDQFPYLCKLDLDLDLPPRYFELLIARMEADPRLGTTSGKPYFVHPRDGRLVAETCGDEMSVGMTKFYRTACFREIGGFVREVMWDGIDCHRCRMLGWRADSVGDEGLRFRHLRPMGSSQHGIWTGRVRSGFGQYFMGTSPLFLLASAAYRLPRHPVVYGSAAMLWGYASSAVRRLPRYDDPAFRRFLRRYQRLCLRHGKREATRRIDAAQAPVWHRVRRRGLAAEAPAAADGRRRASDTRELFGIPIAPLTMPEVVERVARAVESRESLLIGVVNAAKVVNMRRDASLRRSVLEADLVLADGMSVVWAGRALGSRLPERVAGIDLMMEMLRRGNEARWSVYCLGATHDVLRRATAKIAADFPGVRIAGSHHGYFGPDDEPAIAAAIGASAADILLVAMTSPRKEEFLARWSHVLNVPVCHGVGGSFDVLAGLVRRAPAWWRRLGLEWLYRVKQEPRRLWRRYLVTNSLFVGLVLREWMHGRARLRQAGP
jgi:exopolysaccharide biosynthesis WecB/TagA/CpsF family protein